MFSCEPLVALTVNRQPRSPLTSLSIWVSAPPTTKKAPPGGAVPTLMNGPRRHRPPVKALAHGSKVTAVPVQARRRRAAPTIAGPRPIGASWQLHEPGTPAGCTYRLMPDA
jgi:hypothetical protein